MMSRQSSYVHRRPADPPRPCVAADPCRQSRRDAGPRLGPARRVLARAAGRDGRSRPLGRRHLDGGQPPRRGRGGAEPAGQPRPGAGKRSRGELPLLALAHGRPGRRRRRIVALDAGGWRSFNLVLADRRGAVFVRGLGHGHPEVQPLVARACTWSPRTIRTIRTARASPAIWRGFGPRRRPRRTTGAPGRTSWPIAPGRPASRSTSCRAAGSAPVCSSLLALPRAGPPVWLFAAGPPHEAPFGPCHWATDPWAGAWRCGPCAAISDAPTPPGRPGR